MSDEEANFVALPPNRVTVPAEGDRLIMVREKDWNRLRRDVERLRKSHFDYAALAWAFLGIGAGAAISLIPWLAAFAVLPAVEQAVFAWVTPALSIGSIAMGLFFVWALIAARQFARQERDAAADLAEEMDELFASANTK